MVPLPFLKIGCKRSRGKPKRCISKPVRIDGGSKSVRWLVLLEELFRGTWHFRNVECT